MSAVATVSLTVFPQQRRKNPQNQKIPLLSLWCGATFIHMDDGDSISGPRVIPPVDGLDALGPLVLVQGDCAYFKDGRPSETAFALTPAIDGETYQRAMDVGMRRSGMVIYRPLCAGCRKCQPLRVPVAQFRRSRSQKRIWKKCAGRFDIQVSQPKLDEEHLELYRRYQEEHHGEDGQQTDELSYQRFLIETVTDTIELSWRDESGALVGVGILDVTPRALSSVYFYWEPGLAELSLGTYSALVEIELCQRWSKPWYYLGYVVPGVRTMEYKANFEGAEVWDGQGWQALGARDVSDPAAQSVLQKAEHTATLADTERFCVEYAQELQMLPQLDEEPTDGA